MPVYWLISLPLLKGRRDHTWELLQEKTSYGQQLSSNAKLEVPELRVGTLDTLLAHSDDLVKISISTEAIVTKIRRTIHDVAGSAGIQSLKIENLPVESYLTRFRWDEPKFPTRRPVKETIEKISEIMGHVEDDLKVKVAEYNVVKSQMSAAIRKAGGSLAVRDISTVVKPQHLVDSENLTTLFVVVSKYSIKEWESCYEKLCDFVVPRSSRLVAEDQEYALMSVVLFKRVKEYAAPPPEVAGAPATNLSLAQLKAEGEAKQAALESWCKTAYGEASGSDSSISRIHLPAQLAVSILRYGLPPQFQAVVVKPLPKMDTRLRTVLATSFGTDLSYWKEDAAAAAAGALASEMDQFPYISITLNTD
eukprot:gene14548-104_t